MNLLFICTGNTCRSPMAEGLGRFIGEREGIDIHTLSAGLFTAPGAKVSNQSVEAIASKVDISNHVSRPLKMEYVDAADYIIPMTADHKAILLRQFPFKSEKIMTLSEWAGEIGDVEDPFGQAQEVYNACALQIEDWLEKGFKKNRQ